MQWHVDQDENFYYIAGFTSGGAPYDITWEEEAEFEKQEKEQNEKQKRKRYFLG